MPKAEKRDYPAKRSKSENKSPKKESTRRPRIRPKNNPDLIVRKSSEVGLGKNHHTGNLCGHDPESPVFFELPEGSKNRPLCNIEAMKSLKAYYTKPKKMLPMLNAARYLDAKSKRKLKKNGQHVQQRSERREAVVSVLAVLLAALDIKTMRVGKPHKDGKFEGLTMETIAERAKISLSRAEEAVKDCVLAGYLKVFQRVEELDGIYKGLPAIRTLSGLLFRELGLGELLAKSRKFISDRDKTDEQHNYTADIIAKLALALQMQADFIEGTTQESKRSQFFGNMVTILKD